MSKAQTWCQKSKVWAWCKKLETPCQNELDENWGDEMVKIVFVFSNISLQKSKASKSKVGRLGLGFF
jgi:hypothetical protein